MPKKTLVHDIEKREPAPQALEFLVAKAAVRWERARRKLVDNPGVKERDRYKHASYNLRRLASQLIPE